MKIAYIGIKGLPAEGGAARVVEAIVQRLAGQHDITVYCSRVYTAPAQSIPNVHFVYLPSLGGKYAFMASLDFLAACHAILFGDYDLIHLHNIEASFVLPFLRLKYPVISTAHGFAYWRAKWSPLARWLMRMLDWPFMTLSSLVTSVSAKDAVALQSRYHKEVVYIPNGVSTDFKPDFKKATELLTNMGVARGEYLIFVAGRIEPTKGAHLAIEAANRLEQDIPLLIVGDLNQVAAYRKELFSKAGARIHFHPFIQERSLLFGLMASSRGLIFSSSVEAMPMVLLEAASLGVPIIASDIPEIRAIFADGIEYFASGEISSLVEKLNCLLEDEPSMILKSQQMQRWILKEYNWDAIVARYDRLYRQVVGHD
jgi:glycosyltransferase involved in cell wall biosynthesis